MVMRMKIQNDYLESKIGDPKYFFNRDSLKSVDLARLELSVHIFYLTNISVRGAAGRNQGYFAARKQGYLYFIFFDDDITINLQ